MSPLILFFPVLFVAHSYRIFDKQDPGGDDNAGEQRDPASREPLVRLASDGIAKFALTFNLYTFLLTESENAGEISGGKEEGYD